MYPERKKGQISMLFPHPLVLIAFYVTLTVNVIYKNQADSGFK